MGRTGRGVGVCSAEGPRMAAGAKWPRHQWFIIAVPLCRSRAAQATPQTLRLHLLTFRYIWGRLTDAAAPSVIRNRAAPRPIRAGTCLCLTQCCSACAHQLDRAAPSALLLMVAAKASISRSGWKPRGVTWAWGLCECVRVCACGGRHAKHFI